MIDKDGKLIDSCGPLGGCQGGPGEFFGIPYKPDSILDYVHESFGGPHDYLSSFVLYNANGNGKAFTNVFMRGAAFSYSVGALPVAAPFAVAPIITQNGLTPAASIYGISNWSDEHQYNSRDNDN